MINFSKKRTLLRHFDHMQCFAENMQIFFVTGIFASKSTFWVTEGVELFRKR